MNNGIIQFAIQALANNPQVANTQIGKEFMNILQTGDYQRGVNLANNLCQTYGDSKEDAIQKAKNYFHM